MAESLQPHDVGIAFIHEAIVALQTYKGLADKAIAQVSDDQLHVAIDGNTNPIAVIVKHVAGNLLSRWTDFLTTDGEKPWRDRDDEFVDTLETRQDMLACWESGWVCLFEALNALGAKDLGNVITIRGEAHSVPLAIQRSVTHCAYHIGQIIMVARVLARDNWTTLTIPKQASGDYNRQVWGKGHFRTSDPETSSRQAW